MIIESLGVAITLGSLVHLNKFDKKFYHMRSACQTVGPSEKCKDAPFLLSTERLFRARAASRWP